MMYAKCVVYDLVFRKKYIYILLYYFRKLVASSFFILVITCLLCYRYLRDACRLHNE